MNTKVKWLIGFLVIATVALLILSQSLKTGSESSGVSFSMSMYISEKIVEVKGYPERSVDEIELILRKIAHLTEYIFYSTVVFVVFMLLSKSKILAYVLGLLITIPIPFIDELILQRITNGRTSQLLDIGIDLVGIFIGFLIGTVYLLVYMVGIKAKI